MPDEFYDEEAVYQEADILQAEYERESRHYVALVSTGVCQHSSTVGLGDDGKPHYKIAEILLPGQRRCVDCLVVFLDDDDYERSRSAAEEEAETILAARRIASHK